MTDYKEYLYRQQVVKKQTQEANSKYWRMQMQWRQQAADVERQEAYNPHIQWTIEGHARALIENAKRKHDGVILKETLEEQKRQDLASSNKDREGELEIGRQLCNVDRKQKDLENELLEFKRNAFTKELTEAW